MNKRSFGSYIAELIIVIIGVTVAFGIGNIAEREKEKEIVQNYYLELIEDLATDTLRLRQAIDLNSAKRDQLIHTIGFYKDPDLYKDSILMGAFAIGNYFFFEASDITYQSIIASGDLKLIHDRAVKKGLIKLYGNYHSVEKLQDEFLEALDQNFFPLLVGNVDYSTATPEDPNFHKNLQVKNYFLYTINELEVHIKWYNGSLKGAKRMIKLLDQSSKTED